jgi:hypothetical protein
MLRLRNGLRLSGGEAGCPQGARTRLLPHHSDLQIGFGIPPDQLTGKVQGDALDSPSEGECTAILLLGHGIREAGVTSVAFTAAPSRAKLPGLYGLSPPIDSNSFYLI